jgi:heptosyltransferase II
MKLLIELPTWLGDTVMVSPAIECLVKYFNNPKITLIGSPVSLEVFKFHPNINKSIILDKNYIDLYKSISKLDEFDAFFSFRNSIRSKFINFFIKSNKKYLFNSQKIQDSHLVIRYADFIRNSLKINFEIPRLCVYKDKSFSMKRYSRNLNKPAIGINPGASYGNAKQWYPNEFAAVAIDLSSHYDIFIFGSKNEIKIAFDIESIFKKNNIQNYSNLAGKTNISELINIISNLDMFITGDSGPMHLAAAFQVPTIAIFGPTKDKETSQWKNKKSVIVKKNLECQPCMKRICPLNHHNCMKQIKALDVLDAIKKINI